MAKCLYPNEICANMTILNGSTYCDSTPCSLKNELPRKVIYKTMEKGDLVIMNGKYRVPIQYQGKIFKVSSDMQEVCGTKSVWLEGYTGCYAADGLDVICKNTVENNGFNEIAIHNIETGLLVKLDECRKAKDKAVKERKCESEIDMWSDMQVVYGLLIKYLQSMKRE